MRDSGVSTTAFYILCAAVVLTNVAYILHLILLR